MEKLPSYILVAVNWFRATNSDYPNPAKSKFKVTVVVTRAFLWKDQGTRVHVGELRLRVEDISPNHLTIRHMYYSGAPCWI